MLDNHADIVRLQYFELPPGSHWSASPGGVVLILPFAGNGHYASEHVTLSICQGDVLMFCPDNDHKLRAIDGVPLKFGQLSINAAHLLPLLTLRHVSKMQVVYDSLQLPRHYHSKTPLARHCHRCLSELPDSSTLEHRAMLLRIGTAALDPEFANVTPKTQLPADMDHDLSHSVNLLSTREFITSSVSQLAAKFFCSPRHLTRLFHDQFGMSVTALRMEVRLLKAIALLRQTDLKIITIAEQSGFQQLSQFNRCFKCRFGLSPGRWRRSRTSIGTPGKERGKKLHQQLRNILGELSSQ